MRSLATRRLLVSALALAVACGGGSAAPQPDGPPHLGVIAGNHQTITAAPAVKLPAQVVAQVVQLPNGQVGMTTRVINAVLPPQAFAQTAVHGIPGAVVCSVSPDPQHPLTPEVPCTNTDASGLAYFTFHADSVAGVAKAEVRGTVAGVTHVSDSVSATVLPLPAADFAIFLPTVDYATIQHVGDTLDLRAATQTHVEDRYHNSLPSYLIRYRRQNAVCVGTLVNGSCPAPGHWDTSLSDPAFVTGDKMTIRAGDLNFDIAVDSIIRTIPLQVRP